LAKESREPSWTRRNALALVALVPVLVASARLLIFSGGDPALLATTLERLDVPAVVLGSLGPTFGVIVGYTLFIVIANRHVTPVVLTWLRDVSPVVSSLLTFVAFLTIWLTPLRQLLLTSVTVLAGVVYRLITTAVDRRRHRSVPADVPVIAALLAFTILGNQSSAWVPTESVTFDDGSERVVYVFDASEGWFTMVDVSNKQVSRVPVDSVESRTVCDLHADRSLHQIVGNVEPQEPCPTAREEPGGDQRGPD